MRPVLFVLVCLLLAGTGARADGDIAAGRAFAEENCSRCHAVGPTGDSPLEAAPLFRDFQNLWPLESLEEALGEGIVTGHPDMPQFELDPDQIDDLLAYMDSLPAD